MQLHPVVQKDSILLEHPTGVSAVACATLLVELRPTDMQAWVTALERQCQRATLPGSSLDRMLDHAMFLGSHDVPIDRCSEITRAMMSMAGTYIGWMRTLPLVMFCPLSTALMRSWECMLVPQRLANKGLLDKRAVRWYSLGSKGGGEDSLYPRAS